MTKLAADLAEARTVPRMASSIPAKRFKDPARFGRRPDIEMLPAQTTDEEALNDAALAQHQAALAVLDDLGAAGLGVADLAAKLSIGRDQLRRKLHGATGATLQDVAAWRAATRDLTAATPAPSAPTPPAPSAPTNLPEEPGTIGSWVGETWEGDCLPLMAAMPPESVDLILADLPYGTTRNSWDSIIPLDDLWDAYARILRPGGCVVLTAAQPFTSALVMSNRPWFRYEWIWSKTIGSGQLNIRKQPLRTHESVLVFAPTPAPYYPQMEAGQPYTITRKTGSWTGRGYNEQSDHTTVNTGQRWPKSVLNIPNPRIKGGHPTQKPLALFEYLILTYTTPGAVVLDNVMGSGTTAEAALNTGRQFVGMEIDPKFVQVARDRVAGKA